MNGQITTQQLRDDLRAHLDSLAPPPGDLEAVLRRSRNNKVRRVAGPGLLAVAAVGIGALVLTQTTGSPGPDGSDGSEDDVTVAQGPVDLSNGLRAYASPDETIYMGGRELPYDVVELDTDAAATPYGIAYYDGGSPWLLRPDGTKVQLDDGPADQDEEFRPTVKSDSLQPHVAFATLRGDELKLTVYDLDDRSVVARHVVTCPEGCEDRVIDGIDSGAVFLRGDDGTTVWDYDSGERYFFAGSETRVADVRNGVVLYDGPQPVDDDHGWRYVAGAIDAQLTFDGEHVLSWSDKLAPTLPGRAAIKLRLPVPATFFAIDTDGSVLVATVNDPIKVFDCEIPSGSCERIGGMSAGSGDPVFIGSDM